MRRVVALVLLTGLLSAAPAAAQDAEKKVNVDFGGGYTFALSKVGQNLGGGYNFTAGVWIAVASRVSVGLDYGYNGLGQKQLDLDVVDLPGSSVLAKKPFFGDMNMQHGNFNLVLRPTNSGAMRPYLLAGVGIYSRPVKVTTNAVGYIPGFCDPFWYYCMPGGYVPMEAVVGKRSTTDFGIDVGGGINLVVRGTTSIYVEARYHYIWGPSFTTADLTTQKANGQFLPITFGVRF